MAIAEQEAKRVIVVLSAGRSGTSLLMQALGALGMTVSENLIGPHHENPDGFVEDADIVNLHKQLLVDLGVRPVLPLPAGWREAPAIAPYRAKIRSLVEAQLEKANSIWGFKDPRTSSLLPLWIEVLKPMWVTPTFVLAVRGPGAAVRSIITQSKLSGEMAELVWLFRTCDALFNTAADCCVVHYEDWFTDPERTANDLLSHTGLSKYFHGDVAHVLGGIIKPNLNRAVHDEYRITNPYVIKLYEALKECRGTNFDRARLMQVVKECRSAMENFSGWCMEAQKITKTQDADGAQVKRRLERKQAEVDQLTVAIRELTVERDAMREKQKLEQAQSDARLEKLHLQISNLSSERDAELEQHRRALSNMEEKVERLMSDLEDMALQNNAYLKQAKKYHEISEGLAIKVQTLSRPSPAIAKPQGGMQDTPAARPKAEAVRPKSDRKKPAKPQPLRLAEPQKSRRSKLWRKLVNDPERFFADSRVTLIKPLRHLFANRR